MSGPPLRVVVAHPYPDLYGADLMLLRSLEALGAAGWHVLLVVPQDGPLLDLVTDRGIDHEILPFPVLRKGLLSPRGLLGLARRSVRDLRRMRDLLARVRPDVVYVNTLTIPAWLWAARRAGVPSVCHVRELESQTPRAVRAGLTAPLGLTRSVVANSEATRAFVVQSHPALGRRTRVVYNGFLFPDVDPSPPAPTRTRRRVTVVGRLSPRKGQDVALRALGGLVAAGHDIELHLIGSTFTGYEWFEDDLRALARMLGVADRLHLDGYRRDVWPELESADVVVVPSRLEPFGSVAVEALAAARPTVVTDVGGLPEIVRHRRTGLVVPPDDADALAGAIAELLDSPSVATAWGQEGRADVLERFALDRYARELELTLRSAAGSSSR